MQIRERIEKICSMNYSRGTFLKLAGAALAFLLFSGKYGKPVLAQTGKKLTARKKKTIATNYDIVVARGKNAGAMTRKAVETLGGMQRFVQKGDVVVVKPNIGWDRTPAQAANTHPDVVAALVTMCFAAGAKTVKVFDNTCNNARRTYENSGISAAAKKAGATVFYFNDWKCYPAAMSPDALMNEWPVFQDAVECDCFINVPVAKNHGTTTLTLSMKNLMGVCGGARGRMHQDIDRKLVEMTTFIRPELTVIDATRILLRNGPSGGNLDDVAEKDTVVASADPVLADAYATTLFGMPHDAISHIRLGARAGLGSINVPGAKLKEVRV